MEYAITTLEIEIARIKQALRIVRSTTFKAVDADTGFLPDMHYLGECTRDLRLAIWVLQNTNEKEARIKYQEEVETETLKKLAEE
jgi:hypothetical protein